ncbi:D12 class N6 adenine-specific DNA methyltransferase [Vibrio phage 1.115.B._10N.222.49.B11]|nr:D12 class N6 adenine-specific DNA methyltransferase [Vibrio phage 1.115.A._10N.222.49.B11]AUR88612.1 D12 class N6 adenine-specific DNA methyltransferase [Vibrio phage 1.115.B._10N.222.49.B11]
MKYAGSKARVFKKMMPIILNGRGENQPYVEPFLGGANSMQLVDGVRIGGELNQYISSMWKELLNGWMPSKITKENYTHIKKNKGEYPEHVVGWVGVACSYSGKWFGGFAGKVNTKDGERDYQNEAFKNLDNQLPLLQGLQVSSCSYDKLLIPDSSIIYCDPPYAGTLKYKDDFNSHEFWEWARKKASDGHKVFISEYNAPDDFVCVWQQEVKSSLSANGKIGGSKKSVEKLFVHKSQFAQ